MQNWTYVYKGLYSEFCYARNPRVKYFYFEIYVRFKISAWEEFYFTLIFSIKVL